VETVISFDSRLSGEPEFDRKKPSGSDSFSLSDQNSASVSDAGSVSRETPAADAADQRHDHGSSDG
jgi:hypothetical protein